MFPTQVQKAPATTNATWLASWLCLLRLLDGHTLHLQASACASCQASKLFCARLAARMQAFYYVTTYDLYNFMKNFSRATHSTNHAGWPWFLLWYIWSIVSSYPAGPVINNCWEVQDDVVKTQHDFSASHNGWRTKRLIPLQSTSNDDNKI